MPTSTAVFHALTAGAASVLLLSGSGCGRSPADPEGQGARPVAAAGLVTSAAAAAPGGSAPVPVDAAPKPAEAEVLQKLLARIEQLEQRESEKGQAVESLQKSHQEQVEKLLGRIGQLEEKLGAVASARVLPEIALPAEPRPTPEELDQKIRIVERKGELAAEVAEAQAANAPRLTVGSSGFSFSSADTNFVARLRGLVQLDSRSFFGDHELSEGNDSFLLRRARPIFEGTLFRDIDFQFVPEFGGSAVQIFDANFNYRFRPELQLRAGKFKSPVGLEQLQSDSNLRFNERSLASSLVPNRSVGVELWGEFADGAVGYAAGIFNNSGDSRNSGTVDFSDDKEFAGRIFGKPFQQTGLTWLQGLGIGLAGSYSQVSSNSAALPSITGGTLQGYATAGQQQFFAYNPVVGPVVGDGSHWRLSPQAFYYRGPFGLLGEYVLSEQSVLNSSSRRKADLEQRAWQVSAQWMLTGEDATYGTVVPKRPFDLHGAGWGAWQLAARYGQLTIDDAAFPAFSNPNTSARAATEWAVGINWWLNRNLRVLTSFSHTTFEGGGLVSFIDPSTRVAPATVTHQDENTFFTRLQLSF